MVRPGARAVMVSVAAVLLVGGAGVVGYVHGRAGPAAGSVRIDGADHPCGRHGVVAVSMQVDGPGDARFAIDGVEVPAGRTPMSEYGPGDSGALSPPALMTLRCGDGATHRFTALTDNPQHCRWSVGSEQTQEEARGHQKDLAVFGSGCTLTVVD